MLTALDVLGYERPTKLRGERARLVGLVMPELQNPIFPALAEAIGGGLAQNGYTPVLCTQTAGGISESDYVELLLHQQVSGVIFARRRLLQADVNHDHYDRLVELKLPTVLVNAPHRRRSGSRRSRRDDAAVDGAGASGTCAQLGHERIGILLGPNDHVPSQRKLAAARAHGRAARHRARRRPGGALALLARVGAGRRPPSCSRPA